MNTLMINSTKQGISFNTTEAVACFAIIEKIWSLGSRLLTVARPLVVAHRAELAPAHA